MGRAARGFLLALFMAAVLGGAHLSRLGTPVARGVTAALILAVLGLALWRAVRERGDFRDARRTIGRVLVATNEELGRRALRALTVVERTEHDASVGSSELAQLHFERLLRQASTDAVAARARRRAGRWHWAAFAALAGATVAVVLGPIRIVEGLNVLAARDGKAPLAMKWLSVSHVTAQAPTYLKRPDRYLLAGTSSALPQGSIIVVQGRARYEGRTLVLTDGDQEVPFVSDGAGGIVARWTLATSAELRVAARFGEVLVEEPEPIWVTAIEDAPPEVELSVRVPSGAIEPTPVTLTLSDVERVEVQFEASDDHGLRQVDLVLRAGSREDRRVLSRLDGERTSERGGYVLRSRDAFLRRMFLPVLLTVEARDNDPLQGAKWGASEPVTLLPPPVGQPEADRYQRLLTARAELVELLAWRIDNKKAPQKPKARARKKKEERRLVAGAAQALRDAVEPSTGRISVPGGLATFLLGQAKVLERRTPAGGSTRRITEDVLLAVDKAIRGLGYRDARTISKRLGDVAEEAADGAKQARETEKRAAGIARLDGALQAVEEGAKHLARLGALGKDIGSVAVADLRRIRRARGRESLTHVELAARHLAARLRRPNPSFGSAGSSRSGGVESGMMGMGDASGEPSRADDRFDQLASELEQLAREHADEIANMERTLSEAEQAVDLDDLRDEAKQRAEAIRRAVSDLPFAGAEPGSARASAALAREHAGAMAHSLEQLSLSDAVESGRSAMSALQDALRRIEETKDPFDRVDEQAVEDAKRRLEEHLEWAEKALDRLRREAAARSSAALGDSAGRERKLSERAGNLASRGKISESALPQQVVENLEQASSIMAEAARAFAERNADRGLARQREAQRLLEQANTGQTTDSDDAARPRRANPVGESDARQMRTDGSVPDEDRKKRAQDFRKRVLEGLGKSRGGRLSPAVKRYAEGLLR